MSHANNQNLISRRTRVMGWRFGETLVNVLHVIIHRTKWAEKSEKAGTIRPRAASLIFLSSALRLNELQKKIEKALVEG